MVDLGPLNKDDIKCEHCGVSGKEKGVWQYHTTKINGTYPYLCGLCAIEIDKIVLNRKRPEKFNPILVFIYKIYSFFRGKPKFEEPKDMSLDDIELVDCNAIPTEGEILKYYKMYLRKQYLDNDSWNVRKPMEYGDFKDQALDTSGIFISSGFRFLNSMSTDMFVNGPGTPGYTIRTGNYSSTVYDREIQEYYKFDMNCF
jgi:hypothetical protein